MIAGLAGADDSNRIAGVVRDPAGALIPGAAVTILHGSEPAGSAVTDGGGAFAIGVPAPGNYTVEVKAAGFGDFSQPVTLTASVPAASLDVILQIDANAETIEVTADALAAETTSTQLGETLETKKIESVPLNGRSFTDLMAVQPGIVPVNTAQPGAVIMTGVATTPPSGDANPGNLSISGQREISNGFRVNGADVEEDVNMGTSIVPNLDSIDSFRVLTSNFDAEYGNSSGGQVLVTTKSGTDQLHGSAFEFLRNTALDARNYFSADRAAYRQNQFGATLGGARFIGKAFTGSRDYQGTRLTEGIDTGDIAVPIDGRAERELSAQSPLTGSVSGRIWACAACRRAAGPHRHGGRTVLPQVFPDGQDSAIGWSAPAKYLLAFDSRAECRRGACLRLRAEAETLQDDKGGLRADWTHGNGTLTAYYFLDRLFARQSLSHGNGRRQCAGI